MAKTKTYTTRIITTMFGNIPALSFHMPVRHLDQICYVAVRGKDEEEGAVQRVLNKRRISAIRNYILEGNTFFNSFVLNWSEPDTSPTIDKERIRIPLIPSAAQMIDGQHRMAGLTEAMKEDDTIGERNMLVTMCIGLSTGEAASIFLNINTEQRPVPKSLIYDLFGEVVDDENHSVNRATDIARDLNDDGESSLYRLIKFPGSPRGVGSIELSSFVSAFKEHLKPNGTFYTYKLRDFGSQKAVIENFYRMLRNAYEEEDLWANKSQNPFLRAAGFNGSVDYLTSTLIEECAKTKSFTPASMSDVVDLETTGLLRWDELKGLDGKTSRKRVKDYLDQSRLANLAESSEYEF